MKSRSELNDSSRFKPGDIVVSSGLLDEWVVKATDPKGMDLVLIEFGVEIPKYRRVKKRLLYRYVIREAS